MTGGMPPEKLMLCTHSLHTVQRQSLLCAPTPLLDLSLLHAEVHVELHEPQAKIFLAITAHVWLDVIFLQYKFGCYFYR